MVGWDPRFLNIPLKTMFIHIVPDVDLSSRDGSLSLGVSMCILLSLGSSYATHLPGVVMFSGC